MPTFDFQGADVPTQTANYGAEITNGTVNITEQGVQFSLSITGPSQGRIEAPEDDAFNAAFSAFEPTTHGQLSFTMDLIGPDANQFFSDFHLSLSYLTGSWQMQLVQNQTTGGAATGPNILTTVAITAPGPNPTTNHVFAVPTTGGGAEYVFNQIIFTHTSGGAGSRGTLGVESFTTNINCFTQGTRIATQGGATPVEEIAEGTLVRTADGRLEKVLWLGEVHVPFELAHPAKVNPVCITAGALGGGLPHRDLHLSFDHAIEIDGTLYNAGTLVNGETIYQKRQMPREGFTYYHLETEAHELLLAEGVAAESFIDYAGRDSFDNAPEGMGRVIPEMDLPRVSAGRLVPAALKARLAPAAAAA